MGALRQPADELGFNAATAVKPWRATEEITFPRFDRQLQCGHGGEAVESAMRLGGSLHLLQSFNAATAVKPWRARPALGGVHPPLPWGLQCGHGGEAVESFTWLGSCCTPRSTELQCGHGGEAVESVVSIHPSIFRDSIATMRPRR